MKPVSQVGQFFFRNVQLCNRRHGYPILSITLMEGENRKETESICKAGNTILDLDYMGWVGGQGTQEGLTEGEAVILWSREYCEAGVKIFNT